MKSLIAGLLSMLISMPIWYYLLYKVLVAINASELMWFLFWIYVPVGILSSGLAQMAKAESGQ